MRSTPSAALLLCVVSGLVGLLGGCASPEEEEAEAEADAVSVSDLSRVTVVERTRFLGEGKATSEQDGKSVASFRFNGFGNTKVRITVTPKDAAFTPTVALAGPIPGSENKVVIQRRGTRAAGVTLETTLDARGAYRIVVGTQSALTGRQGQAGAFDVAFTCLAGCDLPEVTLAEVLRDLNASSGEADVRAGLEEIVGAHVADPQLREKVLTSLLAMMARGADPNATTPVVPMSMVGVAQGIFEHAPSQEAAAAPPRVLDVELSEIGKDCNVTRSGAPRAVSPRLPGLSVTDVPDYSYDDCALARMEGLAAAFNALSLEDGSVVRDGDARIASVTDLAKALAAKGHTITLDNARYFADFLGLQYRGASVRAPLWVDTGIALPQGGTLRMPAPHAHHNIWIHGPRFDGQLKFFMGVDAGTAFRTQSTVPRHWSGGRIAYVLDRPEDVAKALSTAGKLRKKWTAEGASLPMMGYGRVGVCTDSSAVIEHAVKGTVTLFPLAHPKNDRRADEIDRELAALPSDLAGFDREDALRRIGATIPFDRVDDVPFPAFVSAWRQLAR